MQHCQPGLLVGIRPGHLRLAGSFLCTPEEFPSSSWTWSCVPEASDIPIWTVGLRSKSALVRRLGIFVAMDLHAARVCPQPRLSTSQCSLICFLRCALIPVQYLMLKALPSCQHLRADLLCGIVGAVPAGDCRWRANSLSVLKHEQVALVCCACLASGPQKAVDTNWCE